MRDQAVDINERSVARGLLAVHGDVAHFRLHVERNNVEAANFGSATSDAFHLGDHTLADVVLKRIGGDVVEPGQHCAGADTGGEEQIFPPASRAADGRRHRQTHCVCTPSPGDPAGPGTLTLLSERSDWSQETINSLTFSWVSNSRILPETSARGTSPTPDCFNCGTNFSR